MKCTKEEAETVKAFFNDMVRYAAKYYHPEDTSEWCDEMYEAGRDLWNKYDGLPMCTAVIGGYMKYLSEENARLMGK